MRSIGILLLILGIGTFILPQLGLQFRIMSVFGRNPETFAVIMAIVGAVLLFLSFRRRGEDQEPAE
jgi:hypothetical protein